MKHIIEILYGLVFGIANIIPGVSGGTMLVTFGCYDKVCGALSFNLKEIKKNIVFLIFFGIGAVCGIVGFSFVITFLFDNFPVPTNLFFMGLILGSVPLILRNATVKKKFKPICILPAVIALALVVGLTVLESGTTEPYSFDTATNGSIVSVTLTNNSDRTVDEWSIDINDGSVFEEAAVTGARVEVHHSIPDKIKGIFSEVDNKLNRFTNEEGSIIEPNGSVTFTYNSNFADFLPEALELDTVSYSMDVTFFLTMLGALFVAAIAMIIPGVSGSFVMMTLGVYSTIIAAIKNFDFPVLIPCAIGAIIGLILGARIISFLLKKHSLIVYSAILGLVVGSLYAILPDGFGFNIQTLFGVFAFVIGGAISILVGKHTAVENT